MRIWPCAAITVLALVVPAAAGASTDVAVIGDTLFVSNDDTALFSSVTFNPVPNKYTIDDDNGDISANPTFDCTQQPASPPAFPKKYATCTNPGVFNLVAALGPGKDLLAVQSTIQLDMFGTGEQGDDSIFGGLGSDTLEGNAGDDELEGNGGNDSLSDGLPENSNSGGAGGDDSFFGGPGDDYLQGGRFNSVVDQGSGADSLGGGTGNDTADYSKRTAALTITEDGVHNDGQMVGAVREGDSVTDVETVLGGSGGDRISGGPEANVLLGNRGDDVLDGGAGGDTLVGGAGSDTASYAQRTEPITVSLDDVANDGAGPEGDDVAAGTENVDGGSASDRLSGDSGANVLRGGGGADGLFGQGGDDRIVGGAAGDSISGGGGDDSIEARDGVRDVVLCGSGVDRASVDAIDSVSADCETVRGKGKKPLPRLAIAAKARLEGGRLRVKVTCPATAAGGCTSGRLVVKSGKKQVGSKVFSLPAGKQRAIRVKVGAGLKGRKRARVRATAPGLLAGARKVKIVRP
jgi:Ca2+-binding RTX toxin-like protein